MSFTITPDMEIFGQILNHTNIGGVSYLIGAAAVVLTILAISNDRQHMKTLAFPVALAWHAAAINQHLLLLIGTGIIFVTSVFSLQVFGNVIHSIREAPKQIRKIVASTDTMKLYRDRKTRKYDYKKALALEDIELAEATRAGTFGLKRDRAMKGIRIEAARLAKELGISKKKALEKLTMEEAKYDKSQELKKGRILEQYDFALSKQKADQTYRKGIMNKLWSNRYKRKAGKGETADLEGIPIWGKEGVVLKSKTKTSYKQPTKIIRARGEKVYTKTRAGTSYAPRFGRVKAPKIPSYNKFMEDWMRRKPKSQGNTNEWAKKGMRIYDNLKKRL